MRAASTLSTSSVSFRNTLFNPRYLGHIYIYATFREAITPWLIILSYLGYVHRPVRAYAEHRRVSARRGGAPFVCMFRFFHEERNLRELYSYYSVSIYSRRACEGILQFAAGCCHLSQLGVLLFVRSSFVRYRLSEFKT